MIKWYIGNFTLVLEKRLQNMESFIWKTGRKSEDYIKSFINVNDPNSEAVRYQEHGHGGCKRINRFEDSLDGNR